jgi:hypothetical protein
VPRNAESKSALRSQPKSLFALRTVQHRAGHIEPAALADFSLEAPEEAFAGFDRSITSTPEPSTGALLIGFLSVTQLPDAERARSDGS